LGYIANYGYTDGSGDFYITIDTGKCDGCGKCVGACPARVFEVVVDDYDDLVAKVRDEVATKIKYLCDPCKPTRGRGELKCQAVCASGAIAHPDFKADLIREARGLFWP
jgi:ferredoxin